MERLRKAVEMGYRNLDALRTEAVLAAARHATTSGLLMRDLAMPADPFAPAR